MRLEISKKDFYPRPPRGGRPLLPPRPAACPNFYPRPPRGGRQKTSCVWPGRKDFYPRPPRGGRRPPRPLPVPPSDFYPRPPRGGRPIDPTSRASSYQISIHALREEGDRFGRCRHLQHWDFYPRPPRGGRQGCCNLFQLVILISIHALREEGDPPSAPRSTTCSDFYPRPPRGGRPGSPTLPCWRRCYFYPRPPRGGRPSYRVRTTADVLFLSTPSARRATRAPTVSLDHRLISIHALREEGDSFRCPASPSSTSISIHALREEGDRRPCRRGGGDAVFLSTPSARRATVAPMIRDSKPLFLSTPSARRATPAPPGSTPSQTNFYPRPPRGGRHIITGKG